MPQSFVVEGGDEADNLVCIHLSSLGERSLEDSACLKNAGACGHTDTDKSASRQHLDSA